LVESSDVIARFLPLLLVTSIGVTACSGSDDDSAADNGASGEVDAVDLDDASGEESVDAAGDDGEDDEGLDSSADVTVDVDFQLFSSDEGAGCVVYVSVAEADVSGDLRLLIWQGVVSQEFTDCGFSDVVEVGLLTVNGLDDYDQPDFSDTIEHVYYGVDGWAVLIDSCYTLDPDDACVTLLASSLTE